FFFNKTLQRRRPLDDIPYPRTPRRLPEILTVEEVARLIDSARNLFDRTMLMVLYSTGMRNAEMRNLQVKDIDSKSMLIHIQHGKGGRDRYVPLSSKLLETLREYWRWMKPKNWLFPGTVHNWRADKPITPKVVWDACKFAAKQAGIEKRVYAHLMRHYAGFRTIPGEGSLCGRKARQCRGEARPLVESPGIVLVIDFGGRRVVCPPGGSGRACRRAALFLPESPP